jgi:hypothetical protein
MQSNGIHRVIIEMKLRKKIQILAIVVLFVGAIWFALMMPRVRPLPNEYTYTYYPKTGLSCIRDKSGDSKIGEKVIRFHVKKPEVVGVVQESLDEDVYKSFIINTLTHEIVYEDYVERAMTTSDKGSTNFSY